jgi:hypothetical protein
VHEEVSPAEELANLKLGELGNLVWIDESSVALDLPPTPDQATGFSEVLPSPHMQISVHMSLHMPMHLSIAHAYTSVVTHVGARSYRCASTHVRTHVQMSRQI